MKKALLISIHPEWAEKILNGKKTIEIRTWIPKNYVGWVYVYITKDNYKNHLYKKGGVWTLTDEHIYPFCGKVAFRFFVWRESFVKIEREDDHYFIWQRLLNKSCLTKEELYKYGRKRNLYAWHIGKLEIFDKPKELSEFGLAKAPQKCAWVYIDEKPEPHQVSVLDEEIPSEKDEKERKPF